MAQPTEMNRAGVEVDDPAGMVRVIVIPYGELGHEVVERLGKLPQPSAGEIAGRPAAGIADAQRRWRGFGGFYELDLPPVAIVQVVSLDDFPCLFAAGTDVHGLRSDGQCSGTVVPVLPVFAPWRDAETLSEHAQMLARLAGRFVWTGHHPNRDAAVEAAANATLGLIDGLGMGAGLIEPGRGDWSDVLRLLREPARIRVAYGRGPDFRCGVGALAAISALAPPGGFRGVLASCIVGPASVSFDEVMKLSEQAAALARPEGDVICMSPCVGSDELRVSVVAAEEWQ
jgi:hypothetical protein